MLKSERDLRLATLAQVQARFHRADVLEQSGLDTGNLDGLVEQLHKLAFEHNLRIEVLATPDVAHKDFRSTTLRVLKGNLCVHSQTFR